MVYLPSGSNQGGWDIPVLRGPPAQGNPMMVSDPSRPTRLRSVLCVLALVPALLATLPATAEAQYFGRNKVQYDSFDFRILETTPHFDIHFYTGMEEAISDLARMSERWYERFARLFQHELAGKKPLIIYADHPDFQQTNTISAQLSEGTGGVTESLKNRVIMPFSGSYASTDHVLGHELVHAFQYDLAQSRRGGGIAALSQIPLWMIEGMAEYLSIGREDPLTAMWLRDALLRDDFPTLEQMTRETRFFPYRFGQAYWTYVGSTYGDEAVVNIFRSALRLGWQGGIEQVLGIDHRELSESWRVASEEYYRPLMEGKTPPGEVGALLMAPSTGAGYQNVAPSISPDGRQMVVMSEKDLFSFDLYLADARTGEILRTLSSAAADPHMDALRFIDSSGAWSPDGSLIAIVAFAQGQNDILLLDSQQGSVRRRLRVPGEIGEISSPSWSPDGRMIAFSGQVGGLTDLFLLEIESEAITRLTQDRHADFQPVFSPAGDRLAFVTDRGSETDFDSLVYSSMRIALFTLATGEIEVLELFGNVRHINPQFSPDGQSLYFISDPDGFSDIYRVELADETIFRITEVATGVSGISSMSPAMSVARETGTVVFSVFDEFQFHVYSMDSRDAPAAPLLAGSVDTRGRFLPPAERAVFSRVEAYLADPLTALAPPGTFEPTEAQAYRPGLSLDYLGQPSIGIGADQFGNYLGGSAAAVFSDMLGNRVLGVSVQAQGTFKDIGGQFIYQNRENRWNWGVAAGRMVYPQYQNYRYVDGATIVDVQERYRYFDTQMSGLASYPFSTTRRMDFSGGVTRVAFDLERDTWTFDFSGRLLDFSREKLNDNLPDPLNLLQSSAALVEDNSFFGFTSPIRGGRYRMEVGTVIGNLNFHTVNLDVRRYYNPDPKLTVALRGMHLGRYGDEIYSTNILYPFFLGTETLIRGYSSYSFHGRECTTSSFSSSCPEWDRLFGHRLGVLNAELRVPLFGVERLGLIDFGILPTELVLFADAGVSWDTRRNAAGEQINRPVWEFSRDTPQRVPVVSAGASARVNVLGFMVLEVYYAYPFQRPIKGAHWGFQIAPGW